MDYQVISTKCPVLNKAFRKKCCDSSPDLEVLVRLEDIVPEKVICPEYIGKKCNVNDEDCIYISGWR